MEAAGNSLCEGPKYERIWNVLEMEGFYRRTEQRCQFSLLLTFCAKYSCDRDHRVCYRVYKNALCSLDSCTVTWQRVARIKGSWRGKDTGKQRKFRGILLLLHVLGLQPINESALSTAQQVSGLWLPAVPWPS